MQSLKCFLVETPYKHITLNTMNMFACHYSNSNLIKPNNATQVVVEIPYVIIQAAYYSLIVYSMMSFQWTAAKFFWFYFISLFSFLYFTYYGMMTVSISPNHQVAAIFAATFYSLFNLFSGFFIPRPVSCLLFNHNLY